MIDVAQYRKAARSDGIEERTSPQGSEPSSASHRPSPTSLHVLVTRSARMAASRPTIMGAGIFAFVWLQTIHEAAPGSRRIAATPPTSKAQSVTPTRRARPEPWLLSDGQLHSCAARRGAARVRH